MAQKLLMPKAQGEDKIFVDTHYISTEGKPSIHWHDYYEMEIILSGTGTHLYNGHAFEVSRSDVYLMTYYDFHSLSAHTDIELLHISFSENFAPANIAAHITALPGNFHCRFSEEETRFMEERCRRLKEETNSSLPFGSVAANAILSEMLIMLIRRTASQAQNQPQQMQRAIAYIYKHFRHNLLLSDLAAHLGLSPNYCGNLFTKTFGVSFHDYLLQIRLKYACQLLSASTMPIAEIAAASGFHTVEYFFLSFKKRLGLTPTAYRKAAENA